MAGHTDFSQYSHQQLVTMLYAGEPKTVRAAGSTWDSTGGALHDRANDLERQLHSFADKWDGGAARQYHTMITDLAKGIRKVATTAYDVRDLTLSSAESLEDARKKMPQPVSVPDLAPATVQLATTPLSTDDTLPDSVRQTLVARQTEAIGTVKDHQKAAKAADGAHKSAVLVMTHLAGHYTAAETSMPAAPDAAPPPSVPQETGTDAPTTLPAVNTGDLNQAGAATSPPSTLPVLAGTGAVAAASPLFGRMFTAGLAAASAASAGRFGGVLPRLPGFMRRDGKNTKKTSATPVKGGALGGTGGGVGGGGGADLGGGGGGAPDAPAASPSLSGDGTPSAAALGTGAGAAAAGGAASKGMGMMPMMPMGAGMGGGDMGGGRRIPPWLVETENVWGETAIVAPPVIGEDPV